MARVLMYTTRWCPFCHMARRLLDSKGVGVDEVRVDEDSARRAEMLTRSGGLRTVPQIFVGEVHIGGYQDMAALDYRGELDPLLADTERTS